jgi:uncharacterized protein with PIN domain
VTGEPPLWLADEMVGRLARYLRFLGHDTEYARGLADDEIVERARREGRILLTRDRRLAARVPHAVLLTSPYLAEQLRAVRASVPTAAFEPRFDRCTLCNGALVRTASVSAPSRGDGPGTGGPATREVYECTRCAHRYWEGSHTRAVRQRVAEWLSPGADAPR